MDSLGRISGKTERGAHIASMESINNILVVPIVSTGVEMPKVEVEEIRASKTIVVPFRSLVIAITNDRMIRTVRETLLQLQSEARLHISQYKILQ